MIDLGGLIWKLPLNTIWRQCVLHAITPILIACHLKSVFISSVFQITSFCIISLQKFYKHFLPPLIQTIYQEYHNPSHFTILAILVICVNRKVPLSVWGYDGEDSEQYGLLGVNAIQFGKHRCFRGIYYLHFGGWRLSRTRNQQKQTASQTTSEYMSLFFLLCAMSHGFPWPLPANIRKIPRLCNCHFLLVPPPPIHYSPSNLPFDTISLRY
jgi:hypothetical protein